MGENLKIALYTGLAMFSMFFGAGNIVFSLNLGFVSGDMNFYSVIGLLLTAVIVPFAGLLAMFLFDGNYKNFFRRIGKIPGDLLIIFLMIIIGPFIAIPRAISLVYSTMKIYVPGISLFYFSLILCSLIFVLTANRKKVLHLLGHVLSPVLLISLAILIIKGFWGHPVAQIVDAGRLEMFFYGLKEGYYTVDLLGAFFFSVVILIGLKRDLGYHINDVVTKNRKQFFKIATIASIIGACLLSIVYVAFSYIASYYKAALGVVEKDTILGSLAINILGFSGGIIANVAVALACITTVISLSAVFAEFIQNEFFKRRVGYKSSLLITLLISFAMSNLGFMQIIKISTPILLICYPVLIVLTLLNIAKEVFGFRYIKIPVLITFIASLLFYFVW